MAKSKRFEQIYSQGMGAIQILLDRETGVQYLYRSSGYGGGLTPLLDRNGHPVIQSIPAEEE